MEDSGASNGSLFCKSISETWPWFFYSLIPALGIIILFSFLERRVRLYPKFCQGRPGIAFPVNLVDSYNDRWSHAFAFGSMSTSIILLWAQEVNTTNVTDTLKGTVQLLILIGYALLVSIVFYPILLCLRTKKLPGNVMGFAYSVIWVVFYAGYSSCDVVKFAWVWKNIAQTIVNGSGLFCFLVLTLRFIYGIIQDLLRMVGKKTENDVLVDGFKATHYFERVKFLFTPPLPEDTSGNIIVRLIKRYQVPGFRFSRRNVCLLVLTVLTTMQVSLVYISCVSTILVDLSLKDTFGLTSVVSLVITAIFFIDMQKRYRKHTVQLWRGDRSFCPEETIRYDRIMIASLRYSGYQIAFTIWGFIVLQLLLWPLALIIVLLSNCIGQFIERSWLAFVITILLYYGQAIMCRYVFLKRESDQRVESGGKHTYLGLDNRRLFHVVVYVTIFVNVILGFLSCFYRILKSIVLVTFFIGRVDHCILMKGWESWDQGYRAYTGFLQLEVAQTHPVVITFCHFLLQSLSEPRELFQDSSLAGDSDLLVAKSNKERHLSSFVSEDKTTKRASRLRRRWLVALTLKRNPRLALQRKRALCMRNKESTKVENNRRDMLREGCYSAGESVA